MTHADNHKREEGRRGCIAHDTGKHWVDDLAYIHESDRVPVPEYAPTYSDMLQVIQENAPKDDPAVYRFALVFVDGESGLINCLSSGGSEVSACINLLSRAISIMAHHE